jgi:glycosyltransferase involved in cell wall biosynthesis
MKFSIGIPAYKNIFLEECIKSVLSQTYENFELIILNDCSPQNIDSIIKNFDDKRIKYYKNEVNVGATDVVRNWNKCLNLSSGDYFACIGDDDVLTPDYLKCFVDLINKYPNLDVFHCRTLIIDEDSIPHTIAPLCPEYENIYECMIACMTYGRYLFLGDLMYKRTTLLEQGGYYYLPLGWCSDYLTSFVVTKHKGIAYTSKIGFKYRRSPFNITSTGNIGLKRIASLEFYRWMDSFCDQNKIENDIEKYEHSILKQALIEHKKCATIAFVKQFLGGNRINFLNKLIKLLRQRKIFDVKIKNVIECIISAIISFIK